MKISDLPNNIIPFKCCKNLNHKQGVTHFYKMKYIVEKIQYFWVKKWQKSNLVQFKTFFLKILFLIIFQIFLVKFENIISLTYFLENNIEVERKTKRILFVWKKVLRSLKINYNFRKKNLSWAILYIIDYSANSCSFLCIKLLLTKFVDMF